MKGIMNDDLTSIDTDVLREAIINIRGLLKMPHSPASQSMARSSAKTIESYLPETLEAARRESETLKPATAGV